MSDPREKAPAEMSDRELDAAVAREVFGWKHWRLTLADCASAVFFMSDANRNSAHNKELPFVRVESGNEEAAPRYSTDPTAMMEVIRKMRGMGFSGLIEWLADEGSEIADVVVSVNHDDFEWPVAAEGEKIERTYAIAALLAVREGKK